MAIPIYEGANVGLTLSNQLRQADAMRTATAGQRLDNRKKRQAIEEFILNADRRKAERALGTEQAESQRRQLPSAEAAAITQAEEFVSPQAKKYRQLQKTTSNMVMASDILGAATEETYEDVVKGLGPEMKKSLGLPDTYDEKAVNRARSGIVNSTEQMRELQKILANKAAGKGPKGS